MEGTKVYKSTLDPLKSATQLESLLVWRYPREGATQANEGSAQRFLHALHLKRTGVKLILSGLKRLSHMQAKHLV